jgi:RNA polymerase-binding transcription factor DksA
MAKHKKPAPAPKTKAKKKPAPAKPIPKKSPVKPSVKSSSSKPSKPSPKPAAKPAPVAKPAAKAAPASEAKAAPAAAAAKGKPVAGAGKNRARDQLRSRILGKAKATRPIAFSLDEVREIAKTVVEKTEPTGTGAKPAKAKLNAAIELAAKPLKPHHVKAASLADILGFNPKQTTRGAAHDDADIPDKYRRYYKLLIELRNHVTGQLDQHTEETLKRSSKEDSGDLSSYGQHMADAGTDTFDRDFALSLVSNEQEALSEIEAAIQRIKAGTYGICEVTQQPILKERLLAVPFTRYSAEAQKELERNRHRSRTQAGLFGELGEEGAKISEESDDE